MIRIAAIDNVSARAFQLVKPRFPSQVTLMTPTQSYEALGEGSCDAGLLPTGRLADLKHQISPLHTFGIACTGAVSSVRLFSKRPIENLLMDDAPIFVSEKSQTSRRLLGDLCRMQFGLTPRLTADPTLAHARLFIGEDALCPDPQTCAWPHAIDMGKWWFDSTELPFVFALWVVRKGLSLQKRDRVEEWLKMNTDLAESRDGKILLAEESREYFASQDTAIDYYTRIRPRVRRLDYVGLRLFEQLNKENVHCQLTA